jgi:hypothetical protein
MLKPAAWLLAGALLGAPVVAGADVYKWTDARGATGYGEKPPPGARNVTRLTMEAGNVSVIPLPKAPPGAPPQLQVVESAPVTPSPGLRSSPVEDDATRLARWREQCVAERRVDCLNPTSATFDFAPSFARTVPFGR